MLKEETVEVNDTTYTVRELTIGQMLPLMGRMQGEDAEDQQKAQLDMVSACVHTADGAPLGEAVINLGLSTYMMLTKAVLKINGMDDLKGETGN